jgi:hypothetical protein
VSELLPPTLMEMVGEVKREINARERLYPAWVSDKKIRARVAERRLEIMKAVLARLEGELERNKL